MKILIAPDKFKGSLSSKALCDAIESGIHKFDPTIKTVKHPLADGGDGSLDILEQHLALKTIEIKVQDPLFRSIKAQYKINNHTAYIEMATASGLVLLTQNERNCMYTTTFGTGELIRDAIQKGVDTIYLFIGGSATCDVGIGMATALGYQFLDKNGKPLQPIAKNLIKIATILPPKDIEKIQKVNFITLCDVDNPLYGPRGSAHVFAAQKGANSQEIKELDTGLKHFADLVKKQLDEDISQVPGAGAAGGIGGGSIAFLKAKLQSGIKTMLDITEFDKVLEGTNIIFTGEGKIDQQTFNGKVVHGVAKKALSKDIPIYIIAGASTLSNVEIESLSIKKLRTVLSASKTKEEAFTNTKNIVEQLAYEMIK